MFDIEFDHIKHGRMKDLDVVVANETRYYWCECPHCHKEGMLDYSSSIRKSGIVVKCTCGHKFVMKSPWR